MTNPRDIPKTIVDALRENARVDPRGLAIECGGESLGWRRLAGDAERVAAALARRGVRPGDACTIAVSSFGPRGADFPRVLLGVLAAGGVALPLAPESGATAITDSAARARARFTITELVGVDGAIAPSELLDSTESRATRSVALDPAMPAILAATSGSTGEPSLAVLSHANVIACAAASNARSATTARDVFVCRVPLSFGLGLMRLFAPACLAGRPLHLVDPALARLADWLDVIASARGTITASSDLAWRVAGATVAPAGRDLPSLRFAISSGEPVRKDTIDRFESRFGTKGVIRPGYGLAEATGVTTLAPGEPIRVDAEGNVGCGRALDGVGVSIVDGEIVVRGASLGREVGDAPSGRFRGDALFTGDLGHLDADGHLFVAGRMRALIKRGGASFPARTLEEAALRIEGVVDAAAVGVPSRAGLETEAVFVVVESAGAVDAASTARAIERAVGFLPERVLVVPPGTLPRTPSGKLRHAELRQRLASGSFNAPLA